MLRPRAWPLGRSLLAIILLAVPLACEPAPSEPPSPTASASPPASADPSPSPSEPVPSDPAAGEARWTAVTASGDAPAARADHSWTFDPSGAVAYLFGGRGADGDLADLAAYDLTADAWLALSPAGPAPSPRHDHAAAYVDGLGLVVLGGRTDAGVVDDLWAYDPSADGWRTLEVAGERPPARAGACVAQRTDGRLWLHGGEGADGALLDDTWVYDPGPSTWTRLDTPAGDGPAARRDAACWWTADDRFVVMGGAGADGAVLADGWTLAGDAADGWAAIDADTLLPRADAAASAGDQGAVLVGGVADAAGTPVADLLVFDPRTLETARFTAAADGPPARHGAALVDDPQGERLLLFGGTDGATPLADLWAVRLP